MKLTGATDLESLMVACTRPSAWLCPSTLSRIPRTIRRSCASLGAAPAVSPPPWRNMALLLARRAVVFLPRWCSRV